MFCSAFRPPVGAGEPDVAAAVGVSEHRVHVERVAGRVRREGLLEDDVGRVRAVGDLDRDGVVIPVRVGVIGDVDVVDVGVVDLEADVRAGVVHGAADVDAGLVDVVVDVELDPERVRQTGEAEAAAAPADGVGVVALDDEGEAVRAVALGNLEREVGGEIPVEVTGVAEERRPRPGR